MVCNWHVLRCRPHGRNWEYVYPLALRVVAGHKAGYCVSRGASTDKTAQKSWPRPYGVTDIIDHQHVIAIKLGKRFGQSVVELDAMQLLQRDAGVTKS